MKLHVTYLLLALLAISPITTNAAPHHAHAVSPSTSSAAPGLIVGNRNSHIYHLSGDGRLPAEKNRVYFQTEAEAQAAGYRRSRSTGTIPGLPSMPGDGPSVAPAAPPDLPLPARRTQGTYRPGQTRDTGGYNMAAPIVPDPKMTPGATLPVTASDIAVPGYSKKVRNVPQAVKNQVYAEYGITRRARGEYEIDHLISLELGGSNSIKNLWPESYKTQPLNARVKDVLENRLHALVVAGKVDLATAQREEAADWIAAYKKYVGPLPKGHR